MNRIKQWNKICESRLLGYNHWDVGKNLTGRNYRYRPWNRLNYDWAEKDI